MIASLDDHRQRFEQQSSKLSSLKSGWNIAILANIALTTLPCWVEMPPLVSTALITPPSVLLAAGGLKRLKDLEYESWHYDRMKQKYINLQCGSDDSEQQLWEKRGQVMVESAFEPEQPAPIAPTDEEIEFARICKVFDVYGKVKIGIKDKLYREDGTVYLLGRAPGTSIDSVIEACKKIQRELRCDCSMPGAVVEDEIGGLFLRVLDPANQVKTPVQTREAEFEPVQYQESEQPKSISFEIQRPDVSNLQMETIATSNQPESMFPTEDVAKAIAQTTANVNSASSIFILAPRGCGKTGLLQTAMWETWQLWQSKVDFFIWAGKDDEKYCGIESDPDRYIYSGDKNNAEESVTRLEDYCDRRTAKATGYPTIFVKDENNNTLRACAGFDRIDSVNPKFKAYARMSEADYAVITKGRSKLCLNWMTAHDPRKESTGQSTGVFANVYSVILGRTADGSPMYGMMQECLTGASSNGVVDDKEQRDKLYLQFQEYRRRLNEGKEDGNRVLCLTNVGGLWRLVLLPIYQKDIHTINYKSEAEDPYETFDAQFEEKFGDDPDEIFEEQDDTDDPWEDDDDQTSPPQPTSSKKPTGTLEDLINDLKNWMTQLGHNPTDAELLARFKFLTGYDLNEDGLTQIKKDLGLG